MIEVEIKIPVKNRNKISKELLAYGFEEGYLVHESDTYFNSNNYDLRKKDMALRARSCKNISTGQKDAFLTYKGPKMDDRSMTRKELETRVEGEQVCLQIIEGLGFYPLPPVKKWRQYYHLDEITACLDQVEGLGDFLELEIILEEDTEKEAALERLEDLLEKIGLNKREMVRTSYLSMLCSK